MKRNLKFWTRFTWENIGVDLFIMAILAVISMFSAEGLNFHFLTTVMPYFLCIAAIFGMMMINFSSQMLYVPLLICMGETRRNVLLGFHYFRALIMVVTLGLCALIWVLVPSEVSSIGLRSLPTLLFVLLTASAAGSIMGTLFVRWKWLGTLLIIILCGAMGGMVGFAGVAASDILSMATTTKLALHLETLPWWLVAAVPAALALDIVFQWLLLRRQEVKL